MKTPSTLLESAKTFLYRNGRLIGRKRFEYFFENGPKEAVLSALRAYQNEDGGFGNALEPDIRCPHSQPVSTEMALLIMDELDAFDADMLAGIGRYLRHIALDTGGFPFVLRSVNDYPHTPWWTAECDDVASINPTGRILGLLHKQTVLPDLVREDWFREAERFVWTHMERSEPEGYHDGVQWIAFLEHAPDRERADRVRSRLDRWLAGTGAIERNPHAEGYVHKVLDWAPSPDSYARKFVSDEELETHLSHLVREQREDGGWPINWQAVSSAGESEWRGWITVERLKTLKAYGWL